MENQPRNSKKDHCLSKHTINTLGRDKEFVLSEVTRNSYLLEYAHFCLKDDKKFILEELFHVDYIQPVYTENILLKVDWSEVDYNKVQSINILFRFISDRLKNDKEVVLAVIKRGGNILKYVSKNFRNDRDIVLPSVKEYGSSLEFASDELKYDREICLSAVKSNQCYLSSLPEVFKKDKNFILEIYETYPLILMLYVQDTNELIDDESFLYELDQIHKIEFILNLYTPVVSKRIVTEIENNPDYLLYFAPVNLKPCKK
jgi:hypothetical protein